MFSPLNLMTTAVKKKKSSQQSFVATDDLMDGKLSFI